MSEQLSQDIKALIEKYSNPELAKEVEGVAKQLIPEMYTAGFSFYQHGKYENAVYFFRFLTIIEPALPKNWFGLGASYQMLKNYEKAIEAYGVAALLNANDPYVHMHAADCFFALDREQDALTALNSAALVASKDEKYRAVAENVALIKKVRASSQKIGE